MLEQLIRKRKQNRFQKKLLTYFIPYIDKILSGGGLIGTVNFQNTGKDGESEDEDEVVL